MKKLFCLVLLCASQVFAEKIWGAEAVQSRGEILWTKPICKETGRYIGWPSVCVRNGEILAVFSGDREAHICPWGKTQLVRSPDGGITWSEPETVNNSQLDDRDAGITVLSNGDLVLTWFSSLAFLGKYLADGKMDAPGSKAYYYQSHYQKIPRSTVEAQLGYFSRRSVDGGKSWEEPVRMYSSTPHGCIQLKDGRLLMIGRRWKSEGNFLPDDPKAKDIVHEIAVEESRDFGRSWRKIANILPPPECPIGMFHEPHVVEAADGTLVAQIRCHLKGYYMYQSESRDGGKTWTVMHATPLAGLPPHLLRLADGKLLSVYGRRFGEFGEYACISDDNGRTWDSVNEIKLAGHFNGDLGYPASAQLDDGRIITVYYQAEKPGEKPCLMATMWKVLR